MELSERLEQLEVAEGSVSSVTASDPLQNLTRRLQYLGQEKGYDHCAHEVIALGAWSPHPVVLAKVPGRYQCIERTVILASRRDIVVNGRRHINIDG